MAIIIPSKNIYQITNPKVNNNLIDSVKSDTTTTYITEEFEATVHNEKNQDFSLLDNPVSNERIKSVGMSQTGGGTTATVGSMGYAEALNQKIFTKTIYVPVEIKNGYIKSIKQGTNSENENKIKVYIYGEVHSGKATAQWKAVYTGGTFEITKGDVDYGEATIEERNYQIPKTIDVKYSGNLYIVDFSMNVTDLSNISSANFTKTVIDKKEYFKIDLSIFCGVETRNMGGEFGNGSFHMEGTYTKYVPKQIEISLYGDTVSLSLDKETFTYGSGNNPFSLETNELIQGTKNSHSNANAVLREFANGKETAELLCSIDEYYDEYSEEGYENKPISIKSGRMSFNVGEKVIPCVLGADGKDRPMSTYIDGTPKRFVVMGVNFIYDGAVWQKLTLQEVSKE